MQYQGSKNKIAKKLLPILLKNRQEGQWFVEPFCGSCSIIEKVEGNRIANDNNYYLIDLFTKIQQNYELPETITKEQYHHIKVNKSEYDNALVAFVGFGCSFGGSWFNGYASNKKEENYALIAKNSLLKQKEKLVGINFSSVSYNSLLIPNNSIIYCDPPYENTKKYLNGFNHKEFWQWCRDMSKYHIIYISEYTAPEDFKVVLEIEHIKYTNKNTPKVTIEKLYTI